MDKLTKIRISAVCAGIALVCMLMVMIISTGTGKRSNVMLIIQVVTVLMATACAIVQWMEYLRGYVDSAIERRLKEYGN